MNAKAVFLDSGDSETSKRCIRLRILRKVFDEIFSKATVSGCCVYIAVGFLVNAVGISEGG